MINLWSIFSWSQINYSHIIKYKPKCSMCASCKFLKNDCSNLDFNKMPVHSKIDGAFVVFCTEFVRVFK